MGYFQYYISYIGNFLYICTIVLKNISKLQNMNKENNTTNVGFQKAWDLVPGGKQKETREKIMEMCEWKSRVTFYNKINGKAEATYPEMVVMKGIFEDFNIDMETGEYIKQLV